MIKLIGAPSIVTRFVITICYEWSHFGPIRPFCPIRPTLDQLFQLTLYRAKINNRSSKAPSRAANTTTHSGMLPFSKASSCGVTTVCASAVCHEGSLGRSIIGSRDTRVVASVERITARSLEICKLLKEA